MKRKLLFVIGLAVGYVIGARAGREKYDRLKATAEHYWQDPRVTKARNDLESYARTQAPIIRDNAKEAASKTAAVAKDVAGKTAATAKDVAGKTASTAKDVADKTAATAKDVAGKTAATAKDVADKTASTAKDVADKVTEVTDDVRDQVVKTAADLKDRGEEAVERVALTVSEARDRALEDDLDDEDDETPAK
jgi:gas vesicle protein